MILDRPVHVHFIGIGGISMSGLAEVLLARGFEVTGSDIARTAITSRLEAKGAKVAYGQRAENISGDIDVAVFTAAVKEDNPEYAEAARQGIPLVKRSVLLGEVMSLYPEAIAVAGTHGKTTTTAMVTEALMEGGKDPTVSIGGIADSIGGNIRVGKSGCFVTEACEYTNSFLELCPKIGIILNIRPDHLDFFKDINDIRKSFRLFADLIPKGGLLIMNGAIDNLDDFTAGLKCRTVTFGMEDDCGYRACNISFGEHGAAAFDCIYPDGSKISCRLRAPGLHNVENALAAIAAAKELGVNDDAIIRSLENFRGTHRRFEIKGKIGTGRGITIVDDYAHHPDEIAATLSAASRFGAKRVICVFQPHTYSRVRLLADEFARTLSAADMVILAPIYAAREKDIYGVSSADIAIRLEAMGCDVHCFDSFDDIEKFILENSSDGDLVITMGAGNIVDIGNSILGL